MKLGVVLLMSSMIGKIVITLFPYYDHKQHRYGYKARPALVIGKFPYEDDEYVVLPIATLKRKEFYHPLYDYAIDPNDYQDLGLKEYCFIRCHKQTTINKAMIGKIIGDLKRDHNDIYRHVIYRMKEYDRYKLMM